MKILPYAALPLGLMLVLSVVSVSYYVPANAQVNLNPAGTATMITLNDVPGKVRIGEKVTLAGMLATVDGDPINQVPVNVYLLTSEPKLIVAASGVTGRDGSFEMTWDVQAIQTNKVSNDVTQTLATHVVSLFAQFEGNEKYAASKTGKSTVKIEVNFIKVFVNADKKVYRENETATVFIGFVDSDDKFVDPDTIKADFAHVNANAGSVNMFLNPHIPISDKLEKKKVGSYTYTTAPLKVGHNQITVIPIKAGYNIETETVTITVLTATGATSSGPF